MQNKCVGYGFAIFHDGQLKRSWGGGFARRFPELLTPFQAKSRVDIASCTKTITAIAVLKALEVKGKTDSELIYKYLPPDWTIPDSVKKLTFRDVLSHHSGLKKITDGTYDGVRKSIKAGVIRKDLPGQYGKKEDYQNINYVLCRILLPYIDNGNIANNPVAIGFSFVNLVRKYVFIPAGIPNADFKPWDESGDLKKIPFYYNFQATTVGLMSLDHTLTCGAGGLIVNAEELARVMSALENNKLLAPETLNMMKQHKLGLARSGDYYTHNGGFKDGAGRGTAARHVLCPNNIQVAVVINSANNAVGKLFPIIKNAVEASISEP